MTQDPRHPKSTYEPKYPFNRVRVTESGHEVHMDDTPGKERIRVAHRDGTYVEISSGGKRVDMVTSDHVEYVKGGRTTTVDMNSDSKYGGSVRTNVSGDSHSEIKGASTSVVDGDSIGVIGGDSVSAVGGESVSSVTGDSTSRIGGAVDLKGDSSAMVNIVADISMESGSSITAKVGGATITMDSGSIVASVGGVSLTISGGGFAFSGGSVTHNGTNIGDSHVHGGVQPGAGATGTPL